MKVKKFTAKTMSDAMTNVRNELGANAVILNSRIVYTGGFLGFFRKKNFEIIAAADQVAKYEPKPIRKERVIGSKTKPKQPAEEQQNEIEPEKDYSLVHPDLTKEILKEIVNLKDIVRFQYFQDGQARGIYPEPVQELIHLMNEQELSPSLVGKFTAFLMEMWFSNGGNCSREELEELLKKEMIKLMSAKSFGGITFSKKCVNLIGPTGVGKTTTLAKIAADCMLNHHKKVAFITTDTYRIAAIEQLKSYAQILKVPLEVCYTIEDFQAAIKKFASFDVVLIDTAGRNFRNKQYVEDLGNVIDFSIEIENYLVLALTAKQKDMETIYQQFSSLKIDKFIFTKADETDVYGAILNMIEKYRIGAAYITIGQEVPDDCLIASPEIITNLITGTK